MLYWEQTGLDAAVDMRLSTDGDDEEEAEECLIRAFRKVCFGGFWASVNKRPVAA